MYTHALHLRSGVVGRRIAYLICVYTFLTNSGRFCCSVRAIVRHRREISSVSFGLFLALVSSRAAHAQEPGSEAPEVSTETGSAEPQTPPPPPEPAATSTPEADAPTEPAQTNESKRAPAASADNPETGVDTTVGKKGEGKKADDSESEDNDTTTAGQRPPNFADGFHFGSYGRVIAGGDATGRPVRDADIAGRGSRLDESNYAELELRREDYWEKTGARTRIVTTVAFAHPVFHYNGQFAAKLAVRNLYLEERDLGVKGLSIWAGARMYRGDDIYVLDWWPLDNLNTIGGGLAYRFKSETTLKLHAGLNQPTDPFYRQSVLRPPVHNQLGETPVELLDRQKLISSAKLSQLFRIGESGGIKAVAYGEFHWTGAGQRELETEIYETVPADLGFVVGGEVSLFTGKRSTHLNIYGRYAHGLAAYGELNAPRQLAPDLTTAGAREWLFAVGGNYEVGPFGLLLGSYVRSFRNASPSLDFDDLLEGVVLVRPQIWLGKKRIGGFALEGAYQAQQRGVLVMAEETGSALRPLQASMGRIGVIPFLTPGGAGSYQRPHLRLIYQLTIRDQATRSLYTEDDVFARRPIDHFIGVGAEWWFGSTSYFRD